MKSKYPAVEGVLVALALAYFLGYHAWFFVLKTGWTKTREDKYYGINGKGKIARLVFAHLVSTNSKAAILGVQQSRCARTLSAAALLLKYAVARCSGQRRAARGGAMQALHTAERAPHVCTTSRDPVALRNPRGSSVAVLSVACHDTTQEQSSCCRNAMMGASFQASIAALFFNALLDVLLTPSKLQALQNFSLQDPLLERPPPGAVGSTANASNVDIGVASALAVIMLNLVVILVSMMFFVVCVRLYIHAGYYYRAAAHPRRDISAADALRVTLQAQVRSQSTAACATAQRSRVSAQHCALRTRASVGVHEAGAG